MHANISQKMGKEPPQWGKSKSSKHTSEQATRTPQDRPKSLCCSRCTIYFMQMDFRKVETEKMPKKICHAIILQLIINREKIIYRLRLQHSKQGKPINNSL